MIHFTRAMPSINPENNDLTVCRDVAMSLLLYAGFFRLNEISSRRVKDLVISDSHFTIHVTQSKTNRYRKGKEVVIGRTGNVTCSIANLGRYILIEGISMQPSNLDHVFNPMVKTSTGFQLINKIKPLSYARGEGSIVGLIKKFVPSSGQC